MGPYTLRARTTSNTCGTIRPWPPSAIPLPPDLRIATLTSPGGALEARFAAGAGMVGCSLRHRGDELLGILGGLDAYVERGKTFGIPLLYPWANRLGAWGYEVAGRTVVDGPDAGDRALRRTGCRSTARSRARARGTPRCRRRRGPAWLDAELDWTAHEHMRACSRSPTAWRCASP